MDEEDNTPRYLTIGISLITAGGLLGTAFSYGQSGSWIANWPRVAAFFAATAQIVIAIAALIAAAGVACLLVWVLRKAHFEDRLLYLRLLVGKKALRLADAMIAYKFIAAREHELKATREFCVLTIGPGISELKKMARWHQHNPQLFLILVHSEKADTIDLESDPHIEGYVGIIPLNGDACTKLNEEQLDGRSFTTDHICKPADTPSGYYIAGIGARHRLSRGRTVRELRERIESLVESKPQVFYTRPVSKDGLRLAQKFEFKRVDLQPALAKFELCRKEISKEFMRGFKRV